MNVRLVSKQRNWFSTDVRHSVLYEYFHTHHSAEHISECRGGHPCPSTIYNWVLAFLDDPGSIVQLGSWGTKHADRKLDDVAAGILVGLVEQREIAYLHEMAAEMHRRTGGSWTSVGIHEALTELGFSRVMVTKRSMEASEAARAAYRKLCTDHNLSYEQFVFMDEVLLLVPVFMVVVSKTLLPAKQGTVEQTAEPQGGGRGSELAGRLRAPPSTRPHAMARLSSRF